MSMYVQLKFDYILAVSVNRIYISVRVLKTAELLQITVTGSIRKMNIVQHNVSSKASSANQRQDLPLKGHVMISHNIDSLTLKTL